MKANDAKDLRWVSMMLAEMGPGELYVPIKIEARSNKRGKISIIAKNLSYEPIELDHAEVDEQTGSQKG